MAESCRMMAMQAAAVEAARADMERLMVEEMSLMEAVKAEEKQRAAEEALAIQVANQKVAKKRASDEAKEASKAVAETKKASRVAAEAEAASKAAAEADASNKAAAEAKAASKAAAEAEAESKALAEAEAANKAAAEAEAANKAAAEAEAANKAAAEAEAASKAAAEAGAARKAAAEAEAANKAAAKAEAASKAATKAEAARKAAAEAEAASKTAIEAEAASKKAAESEAASKAAAAALVASKAVAQAEAEKRAASEAEEANKTAAEALAASNASAKTEKGMQIEEAEASAEGSKAPVEEDYATIKVESEAGEDETLIERALVEKERSIVVARQLEEKARKEYERQVALEVAREEELRMRQDEESSIHEAAVAREEAEARLAREAVVAWVVAEETASLEAVRRGQAQAVARDLEEEVGRLGQLSPPQPQEDEGALLAATQGLTRAFSSALIAVTEEGCPLPPPPGPSSPPPPPPPLPSSPPPGSGRKDSVALPSPPPDLGQEREQAPAPPRPAPPAALLAEEQEKLCSLEQRVDTQYKKYPASRTERGPGRETPPRPSPPKAALVPHPPQRSSSREQVKSCPGTPRSSRKQVLVRAVRTPSPNCVVYVSAESPVRAPSGTFQAVPCVAAPSPGPDSPGPRALQGHDSPGPRTLHGPGAASPGPRAQQGPGPDSPGPTRAVAESLARAGQVSAAVTARVDGVRSHRVARGVQDIGAGDRRTERAIAGELEMRQREAEGILRKKKDEEHVKRLEFEEQRIKEENDRLKKEAEEKKKREQEDARLQELLKSQEESKVGSSPAPVSRTGEAAGPGEPGEEGGRREEEERMIRLGREEHHRQLERRLRPPEEPPAPEEPRRHDPPPAPRPAPIRQAAIAEFLRPVPSGTSRAQQQLLEREEPRTLAVVEDREKGFSSFNVFQANKQMQKPKYQTFMDQSKSHSSSSSSRRWQNVNTGLVKDRATAYTHQEPASPSARRALPEAGPEPARRRPEPAVALVQRGPLVGSAVAGLAVTMAELETLGARGEGAAVTSSASMVSQAAVSVRDAAKGVREVAQCLLSTLAPEEPAAPRPSTLSPEPALLEETDEEDDFGYEEEHSVGIDLPQGLDPTSGNVTPTPTTGELEELSISSQEERTVLEDLRSGQGSRATPLKSLLKKPSVDISECEGVSSDSESEDGKISPKKVHFSEIDQVKLMSQESLASLLSSEAGCEAPPPCLLTSLPPAPTAQTTYLLASPSIARVARSLEDRRLELARAIQD